MPIGTPFQPSPELAVEIRALYEHGFPLDAVARLVGVSNKAIWNFLHRTAVVMRPTGMTGLRHRDNVKIAVRLANSSLLPGQRTRIMADGYVMVHMPNHPYANNAGEIREHRWVMEQILGRMLRPEETVHHLNGIRDDNRPNNLEVFETRGAHSFIHAIDGELSEETKRQMSIAHQRQWDRKRRSA